jgi:hypothetical protein
MCKDAPALNGKVFGSEYLLFGKLPNWEHFSLVFCRPAARLRRHPLGRGRLGQGRIHLQRLV